MNFFQNLDAAVLSVNFMLTKSANDEGESGLKDGIKAYAGASALQTGGSLAYMKGVIPSMVKADPAAFEKVKRFIPNGISYGAVDSARDKIPDSLLKRIMNPGPSYNAIFKDISMGKGKLSKGPGILAHEIGHARGGSKLIAGNIIGKQLLALSLLGAAFGNDTVSGGSAIAGTAAAIPVLASEIDASRRGAEILKRIGTKGMRRFTPYAGVPTYLGMAAMPYGAYKLKQHFSKPDVASWKEKARSTLSGFM